MAASKAYIIYSKAMDTKQACKNTGKGYKAACPLFSSDSSEAVVGLPTIFSLVCHDANNWTTSIKSKAETRYMNKASIQNTPVNMLVGSKILVHAMPIFYLQIY